MHAKRLLVVLLLAVLAGCASNGSKPSATEQAVEQTEAGFGDAATAPLEDLNLKRKQIPELLKSIDNPYRVDPDMTCADIGDQVAALNDVLGRDWDVPPPDKKSLDERAAEGASTAFLDTLASGASGLIPYRSVVRTVTGANSHQRKVLKAYDRGAHRRTFLKAIGEMKGCPPPAAPLPLPEDDPKIVFK